jgi:hypothetical protein
MGVDIMSSSIRSIHVWGLLSLMAMALIGSRYLTNARRGE